MKNDTEYKLMGNLYHNTLKKYLPTNQKNIMDYFSFFLGTSQINDISANDILLYDYYSKNARLDFEKKLSNEVSYINSLNQILKHLSPSQTEDISNSLNNIISTINDYSDCSFRGKTFDKNKLKKYSTLELSSLKTYYTAKENNNNIGYKIYLLIYLSLYKRLPENFYFGMHYRSELEEFNNEVTLKYGVTSKPGVRAIISLVEREESNKPSNLFAMYEYADMLYYGSKNGPKRNIREAFNTYKKISNENDHTRCHPLAFWSLSFIFFNYHQPHTELEFCETIPEVEQLSRLDQIEESIKYAKYSYDLIHQAAAANILGKISLMSDEDIDGIEELKHTYSLQPPLEYFEFAKQENYIYAYANIASVHIKNILKDPKHKTKHLENYLSTLEEAANQFEPWAGNALGRFYLFGFIPGIKYDDIPEIKDLIDRKKAFHFFTLATTQFHDLNSGWAYANMIISFPDKYVVEKELSTLKSHLTCLKSIENADSIDFTKANFERTYKDFLSKESIVALLSLLS